MWMPPGPAAWAVYDALVDQRVVLGDCVNDCYNPMMPVEPILAEPAIADMTGMMQMHSMNPMGHMGYMGQMGHPMGRPMGRMGHTMGNMGRTGRMRGMRDVEPG